MLFASEWYRMVYSRSRSTGTLGVLFWYSRSTGWYSKSTGSAAVACAEKR